MPPICSVLKFNIQLWFELTQVTVDFITKYLKRLIGGTNSCNMNKKCKQKRCARHLLALQVFSIFWEHLWILACRVETLLLHFRITHWLLLKCYRLPLPANTELALILQVGGTGGLGTFLTLGLALIGALRGTMSTKVALFQIWQICPPTPWLWTRGRCCSSRSCSGLSTCSAGRDRLGSHTWFIKVNTFLSEIVHLFGWLVEIGQPYWSPWNRQDVQQVVLHENLNKIIFINPLLPVFLRSQLLELIFVVLNLT